MNNKAIFWLVTVVITGIFLFYMFEQKSQNQPRHSQKKQAVKKASKKTLFGQEMNELQSLDKKALKVDLKVIRKKKSLLKQLPLIEIKTQKDSNGNIEIGFTFKHRLVGFKGDLDAIEATSTDLNKREFLVVLEPLSSSTNRAFKRVSFNDLLTGIKHSFKFGSSFKKTVPYALLICRDQLSSNSCLDKKKIKISELIGRASMEKVDDYIYYFQALLINNDSISLIKDPRIGDQSYKDLTQYLKILGHDEKLSADIADKIRNLNKTISSIPVMVKNQDLTVELPYQNKMAIKGIIKNGNAKKK